VKECSKCKQTKDVSEFNKHKAKPDGLQTSCRECSSSTSKQWYADNKNNEEVRKRIYDYNDKIVEEIKQEIDEYKHNKGCSICSENHPCCLDFHHIDKDTKNQDVSYLIKNKNRKKIYEEIEKCIIVCANCHRKIHAGIIKPS
jgi:hypothetical protein